MLFRQIRYLPSPSTQYAAHPGSVVRAHDLPSIENLLTTNFGPGSPDEPALAEKHHTRSGRLVDDRRPAERIAVDLAGAAG